MSVGVKDLGSVGAVFAGRHIAVISLYVEGQPVRSVAASQGQPLSHDGSHWIGHTPDVNARVIPRAVLPDLALIGGPADPMQQAGVARRVVLNICGDDPTRLEVGDLHPPQILHVVDHVVAFAVDGIGSEDTRIGSDAGYFV